MKSKKIVTGLLLVFIAVSVIFALVKETGKSDSEEVVLAADSAVIVYYFHGNMRCVSCNTIERLLLISLQNEFPLELEEGALSIRIVNIEERENEHFVTDFELATRTVVVENTEAGEWRKLDRVWELTSDSSGFYEYVTSEVFTELETL